MNPIALGMTGLFISLWMNGFNLLGIGAKPAKEGAVSPTKTVAVAGSLIGAITLVFMAIVLTVGQPFGAGEPINFLFATIGGMYGLLHIGFFAAQWFNLDGRPVGNACLGLAIVGVIQLVALASLTGMATVHLWLVWVVCATYVVLLLLFWGLLYGKVGAKLTGWWLIVTAIGTAYLLFFGGGILPTP